MQRGNSEFRFHLAKIRLYFDRSTCITDGRIFPFSDVVEETHFSFVQWLLSIRQRNRKRSCRLAPATAQRSGSTETSYTVMPLVSSLPLSTRQPAIQYDFALAGTHCWRKSSTCGRNIGTDYSPTSIPRIPHRQGCKLILKIRCRRGSIVRSIPVNPPFRISFDFRAS